MKKTKIHLLLNAKKIVSAFCITAFLMSLIPVFTFANEPKSALRTVWENPFTQTTFRSTNEVNSTFYTFPKMIWDGSQYVESIYNSSDMSAGIGSVYLKVFPDHTVFYDPYRTEERIERETWTVEYYNASSSVWLADSPVDEDFHSKVDSFGIYFDRKTTLNSGSTIEESYWLRIGSELKISVALHAVQSGVYRVVWLLDGISGTKARWSTTYENVTSELVSDKSCSRVQFGNENGSKCLVDWSDACLFNETSLEWESCFQELELKMGDCIDRRQARITFGNFSLTSEESVVLDPTITTLNSDRSLDGEIFKDGRSYPPNDETCINKNGTYLCVGQVLLSVYYWVYRSYLSFDTSSVPALAYNMSATLKLRTGQIHPDTNFTVQVWGGNQPVYINNVTVLGGGQPIYNNSLTADSWGTGRVRVAEWNTVAYQNFTYINLTIPANQVNKCNSTEFELNSSREGISPPQPYQTEWVDFYSGDSQGNEPKLEVSYNLDILTVGEETWFYRNVSSSKAILVLFGADNLTYTYINIRSIDLIGEKNFGKILFLEALIETGFSVFTPSHGPSSDTNHTYYENGSTWIQDLTTWLMYNQTYTQIFLFGFSGGGLVVGNEIQKDYATRFSAAVMNDAPVNYTERGGIWYTASTASKAKVATSFIENIDDSTVPWPKAEKTYYDNALIDKEWHNWTGNHGDFFEPNKTCLWHTDNWASGENDSVAVITWFNATHPPFVPFTPSGPNGNYTKTSYGYTSGTIDPNGDNVMYEFDWEDGTNSNTSYVPSGTNVTVYHAWNSTGTYNVTVRAKDATNWSAWTQPKTITISNSRGPGDVNHDNIVNVFDGIILANAFGSVPGSSNWNSEADLNNDNSVDIFDAIILSSNFGNSYNDSECGASGQSSSSGATTQDVASILVDPSQTTVFKDEVFNVTVNIGSVTDLLGWEFKLYWNSTILNCTNVVVQSPNEWQNNTQDYGPGLETAYNATHARFWKAETAAYPAPSFNGSMTIATLTFRALQPGITSLTLADVNLGNSTGRPIDYAAISGSVTIYYGRYMRSDAATVNGLNTYLLNATETTSYTCVTQIGQGLGASFGIRAWVRASNGTEYEVTLDGQTGTPKATVTSTGWGAVNVTQMSMETTFSLVIRVYVSIEGGAWTNMATFTTTQLGKTSLQETTWSVYYHVSTSYYPQIDRTTARFYWGDASHMSRIQNLQFS